MTRAMTILRWNGTDLPEGLRHLPPGEYAAQRLNEVPVLTAEEDEGLRMALEHARSGHILEQDALKKRMASKDSP